MPKWSFITKRVSAFYMLIPLYICLAILFGILIKRGEMQLLNPADYIAEVQSKILWSALVLAGLASLTIICSFYLMVWRFKEGSSKQYEPTWKASKVLLTLGWGIPFVVVAILSVFVWRTAHAVDPYRPLNASVKPVTIQVVALRWKWLFLYPNDHIATVNMLEIPAGTPISLRLTADAPMNSFWVPRISGQVYAMPGMVTQLHIQAEKPGNYAGSPAEMSGDGFAGMDFTVKAVSAADYNAWKMTASAHKQALSYSTYTQLAKPSSYNTPTNYVLADPDLFNEIVMQFMAPGADSQALHIKGETV